MTTNLELFATTALIALFSSVVATILGYPIGNWLAGTGRRTRQLVSSFLLVPFLLPPFLIGITLLPLQPNTFSFPTQRLKSSKVLEVVGPSVPPFRLEPEAKEAYKPEQPGHCLP